MEKRYKLSASLIALMAVMISITIIFTLAIRIPFAPTKGYISLADVAIYFSSFAFGPFVGAFAGGFGTGLADVIGGYAIPWAPLSLVIHGLQGLVAGLFARKGSLPFLLLGWAAGMIIMVGGYFSASSFLYGVGAAAGALPGDLTQASVGGLGGALLFYAVKKSFPSISSIGKNPEWTEE